MARQVSWQLAPLNKKGGDYPALEAGTPSEVHGSGSRSGLELLQSRAIAACRYAGVGSVPR
ncbi:hypothetical protein Plhal304r1_c010g0039201 [Plasmopara halstedii]